MKEAYSCKFRKSRFKNILISLIFILSIAGCGSSDEPPTSPTSAWYFDADKDGYGDPADLISSETKPNGYVDNNLDCDDTNANINPVSDEICDDDVDNDCDKDEDCEDSECEKVLECDCTDDDGDDYYAGSNCGTALDCDDTNANINPVADEICDDDVDNDCDGDKDCDDSDCLCPD